MNHQKLLHNEEKHHDDTAESYSERRETDFIWEVPEKKFLIKQRFFQPKNTIIDMGCGPSTPIRNSFSENYLKSLKYIGVDISREMLRIAKRNIPNGIFKQGDVETITFPLNYADVIVSLGTLHHALNKQKTLIHWYKILKPGGYILLREPTFESLKQGEGESPHEEGIIINDLVSFIDKKRIKIIKLLYFNTKFFHLVNKIMIKINWKTWENNRLGRIILTIDIIISKLLGNAIPFLKGSDVIIILQKL